MEKIRNNPTLYQIILLSLLAASLAALWVLSPLFFNPRNVASDDYVRYWAGARLFISGGDPYNPPEIQEIQDKVTGPEFAEVVMTPVYIPPWSWYLLLPFALFGYPISRIFWLGANVAAVLVAAELSWQIYGGPKDKKWIAWLAVFIFGPTISVLQKGQVTTFMLLGLVSFMYFIKVKPNSWLAGSSVLLLTLKPQLFYLFWPALGVWIVYYKQWKILIALFATAAIATIVALIIDPAIFLQYLNALRYYPPTAFATPTIGGVLRYFIFGAQYFSLQYFPVLLGGVWFLFFELKSIRNWNWLRTIHLLLLVSLITSPYNWSYDLVLLGNTCCLVAILALKVSKGGKVFLGAYFIIINLLNLFLHRGLDDFWFFWFGPAVLIWFLVARQMIPSTFEKVTA